MQWWANDVPSTVAMRPTLVDALISAWSVRPDAWIDPARYGSFWKKEVRGCL